MPSHTDPNMLLSFLLLLIIASLTAYFAKSKGRNPLLWFVIGVLLGIFAPLILLFFSSVKNDQGGNGMPTMAVSDPDPSLQNLSSAAAPTPEEIKQQEDKLWYYLDQNHQQIGPVSIIALRELWNRGLLELNSYVWSDGMEKWEKVDDLPHLKIALSKP